MSLTEGVVTREATVLPLRLAAGAILAYHGAKALGFFDGMAVQAAVNDYASRLSSAGLEPAVPLAWLFSGVAFLGGICLILGLATRPAAIAAALLGVVVVVFGPSALAPGDILVGRVPVQAELAIMIVAAGVALFAKGGGTFSLDDVIFRRRAVAQAREGSA